MIVYLHKTLNLAEEWGITHGLLEGVYKRSWNESESQCFGLISTNFEIS